MAFDACSPVTTTSAASSRKIERSSSSSADKVFSDSAVTDVDSGIATGLATTAIAVAAGSGITAVTDATCTAGNAEICVEDAFTVDCIGTETGSDVDSGITTAATKGKTNAAASTGLGLG